MSGKSDNRNRESLGERELEILKIIWSHPELGVRDIHRLVEQGGSALARTTVLTLIQRLESKGFIERIDGEQPARYRALEKRESVLSRLSKSFVHKILDGSLKPLMQSFLSDQPSEEELDALQALIDEHREVKRGDDK